MVGLFCFFLVIVDIPITEFIQFVLYLPGNLLLQLPDTLLDDDKTHPCHHRYYQPADNL